MNRKQKKLLDKHRNTLMYVEVKGKSVEKALSLFKKRVNEEKNYINFWRKNS